LLDNYDKAGQADCRKSDVNSAVSILGESLNKPSSAKAVTGNSLLDAVNPLFTGKAGLIRNSLTAVTLVINRQRISI
jgi:hypothetical protein